MILDVGNEFIKNIIENCNIDGKDILEIGCGTGRITNDLAKFANKILAIDIDADKLSQAKKNIMTGNVEFIRMSGTKLNLLHKKFDVVIYSLSLHHIPINEMDKSLEESDARLKRNGKMVIIEPSFEGPIYYLEEKFDIADGNERNKKIAAYEAIHRLKGWKVLKDVNFETEFHFDDFADFVSNFVQQGKLSEPEFLHKLEIELNKYKLAEKIKLWAERRLNILIREN